MYVQEFESFVRAVVAWPLVSCVLCGIMLALPRPRRPCGAAETALIVVAPQVAGAAIVLAWWVWSLIL